MERGYRYPEEATGDGNREPFHLWVSHTWQTSGRPSFGGRFGNGKSSVDIFSGGLVDVGAHTVTHPRLSRLPRSAQAVEIDRSRAQCRAILGRDPVAFSYPNGDYAAESVELVRAAGFALACDSRADLVWAGDDAHRIPRISVRDESGAALARRLRWECLA